MRISSVLIFLIGVFIASCSQIILKKSASDEHQSFIREYLNIRVIVGYTMMVISTILSIIAYWHIEYKNGPVIESTGYIFVMILSYFILNEKITKKKLLGNLLILIGVFVFCL